MAEARPETGFYCSTSGTFFSDKESLTAHYRSDFHKYNLKRKVAGLPPVTKEWFEARKQALNSSTTPEDAQKVWTDPLTKKKFMSEKTYQAYVSSKKYQDLVKQSGQQAPAPIISSRPVKGAAPVGEAKPVAAPTYHVKPPSGGLPRPVVEEPKSESEDSAWDTASEEEEDAELGEWEEWDVTRSLFDNHISSSFEENLEYMYKNFGFYFSDVTYLRDPAGLLKYLGYKLQYGKVPLYVPGSSETGKQFRSLHAVQRHMVDTNQCKMAYSDNEDEYDDFYDFSTMDEEAEESLAIVADGVDATTSSGFELAVQSGTSGKQRIIGSRQLARYYRQSPRPDDDRLVVVQNKVLAKYRSLGIETAHKVDEVAAKADLRKRHYEKRSQINLYMKSNVIRNLPKNCTF